MRIRSTPSAAPLLALAAGLALASPATAGLLLDLDAATGLEAGAATGAAAAADLDGDGRTDLVFANEIDKTLTVLRRTGSLLGHFAEPLTLNLSTLAGTTIGSPRSLLIEDLDGDGKPDVIARGLNEKVAVFRNTSTRGAIKFATEQTVTVAGGNGGLAIADVNADGRPELVAGTLSTVEVLPNQSSAGNVAFGGAVSVAMAGVVVVVADLNADGKPEVIAASSPSNTVKAAPNTGSGTGVSFGTVESFNTAGSTPRAVAAADLTGDGRPELLVVNRGDNTLSALRNTTTGSGGTLTFAAAQTFALGTGTNVIDNADQIAAADMDGDGAIDLAVANSTAGTLSLLRNASTADTIGFDTATLSGGLSPFGVVFAEFTGDATPELVVANYAARSLVFENLSTAGSVSFRVAQAIATGDGASAVAAGDLDGDGKADLVVANGGTTTVSVLRNTTTGLKASYAAPITLTTGTTPRAITLADLDGDALLDIAVANTGSNNVSVFRSQSSPGTIAFASGQTFAVGSQPRSVAAADVDGDALPDLLVANAGSDTVSVLRNTSTTGAIGLAAHVSFAVGDGPADAQAADLDGDGRHELIAANYGVDMASTSISVLRNTSTSGAPGFETQETFAAGDSPQSLALGDFDGDGKTDIAVANRGEASASVFRNVSTGGDPALAAAVTVELASFPESIAAADMDQDGKLDLVATTIDDVISLHENASSTGAVAFAKGGSFGTGRAPAGLALASLDGDALLDVVTANRTADGISVLQGVEIPAAQASGAGGGGGGGAPGLALLGVLAAAALRRRTAWLIIGAVASAAALPACKPAEAGLTAPKSLPAALVTLTRVSGASPFAPDGCGQADVPIYQALPDEIDGFDGQQFGEEADVSIAVNPHDDRHLVAAWVQDAALGLSTAVSFDGGKRWERTLVPGLTVCNGGEQERVFHARLAFGPDGRVYLAGEADDGLFPDPRQLATIRVPTVHSVDGGRSWSAVSFVDAGAADAGAKGLSTVAAEPDVAGAALVAWHTEPSDGVRGTWVSRTTDGGLSWTRYAARSAAPGRLPFNRIQALRDGTLLLIGGDTDLAAAAPYAFGLGAPGATPLVLQRSTDKAVTWSAPVTVAENAATQWPATVEAPDGSLYLAWLGYDASGAVVQFVARSTDGAQTWSEPVAAARPDHGHPALAVSGDGSVGFVYLDHRRDDPATPEVERDAWLAYSVDQGLSWREQHLAGPFTLAFLSQYMETAGTAQGFAASVLLGPPYAADGPSDVFVAQIRLPGRAP